MKMLLSSSSLLCGVLATSALVGASPFSTERSEAEQEALRPDIIVEDVVQDVIPLDWEKPLSAASSGNHIFNSVNSLMQRFPNTYWRNGHTIVPAIIPAGTVLYHGRSDGNVPTKPEWLAFDFEHSYMFCRGECYVVSMVATRDLRLAYFDGSSAAKVNTGAMDSQDLVIWGKVLPNKGFSEWERIVEMCEWGKKYDIDGIVRMEQHFEVMMCDFSAGMEPVTVLNLLPTTRGGRPGGPGGPSRGPGNGGSEKPGPFANDSDELPQAPTKGEGRRPHKHDDDQAHSSTGVEHHHHHHEADHPFHSEGEGRRPHFRPEGEEHRPHFHPEGEERRPHFHPEGEEHRPHFHPEGEEHRPHFRPEDEERHPHFHGMDDGPRPHHKHHGPPSDMFDMENPCHGPHGPPGLVGHVFHFFHSVSSFFGFSQPPHPEWHHRGPPPPPGFGRRPPMQHEHDDGASPEEFGHFSDNERPPRLFKGMGKGRARRPSAPHGEEFSEFDQEHRQPRPEGGRPPRPMKGKGPERRPSPEHEQGFSEIEHHHHEHFDKDSSRPPRPDLKFSDIEHRPEHHDHDHHRAPLDSANDPSRDFRQPHHHTEDLSVADVEEVSNTVTEDVENIPSKPSEEGDENSPPPGPGGPGGPGSPGGPGGGRGPGRWPEPAEPPAGWKGSLLNGESAHFEVFQAGAWHDRVPGETRVRIDYTGLVTFYDSSLTSLVKSREGQDKLHHRLLDISKEDTEKVMSELDEVFSREWPVKREANVDWASITRVIVERYGDRLEGLKYLLEEGRYEDVDQQIALFRNQLLLMLSPYMVRSAVPEVDADPRANTTWVAPIVHYCSTTLTSHIDAASLTSQEVRILGAVQETLDGVCSTLGSIWVDTFDVEEKDAERKEEVLASAREKVADLMAWLDWSMWIKCDPGCSFEEMCWIPAWPNLGSDPYDMTPRCVRRFAPFTW